MRRAAIGLALLVAALAPCADSARAQDLNPRKGFSIRVTDPKPTDILVGEVTIRAEVQSKREEDVARVDFFVDDRLILSDTDRPFQAVYNFGKKSGVHVIRAVARHRDGPTASDFVLTKSFDFEYTVNVQRVVLDVSVRDDKRRVVQGLGVSDFQVVEETRAQRITSVSPERRPLLVGVLMDTSGSMRDRMKEAQDAACGFTDTLEAQDRAFFVDFDEAVTLVEETISDKVQLCKAIRSTSAVGGTALYDAVHAAYRVIHEAPAERRALVVLSDGEDTESRIKMKDLIDEARLNDVTVYAIGLDVGGISTGRRFLDQIAEETGGRAFFVKKASELAGTYGLIAEELRTQYQIVYSSDNQKFDGRFMPIKVRVVKGSGYEVRHRSGYTAVQP